MPKKFKKIDGKNAWAWSRDGRFNRAMERFDEAIECFEKVLKIDPTYKHALYGKIWALNKKEKKVIRTSRKEILHLSIACGIIMVVVASIYWRYWVAGTITIGGLILISLIGLMASVKFWNIYSSE